MPAPVAATSDDSAAAVPTRSAPNARPTIPGLKAPASASPVVLTGRGAPPALIDAADLVTEMVPIKHPYDQGIPAQRGIEF